MRDQLMRVVRRFVEDALPWYRPEQEAAKEQRVDRHVREAETQVSRLGSYHRVSHR